MGRTYVSFIRRYDHPGSFSDRRHCVHHLGEKTMMTRRRRYAALESIFIVSPRPGIKIAEARTDDDIAPAGALRSSYRLEFTLSRT